jgi:hypothetical protein
MIFLLLFSCSQTPATARCRPPPPRLRRPTFASGEPKRARQPTLLGDHAVLAGGRRGDSEPAAAPKTICVFMPSSIEVRIASRGGLNKPQPGEQPTQGPSGPSRCPFANMTWPEDKIASWPAFAPRRSGGRQAGSRGSRQRAGGRRPGLGLNRVASGMAGRAIGGQDKKATHLGTICVPLLPSGSGCRGRATEDDGAERHEILLCFCMQPTCSSAATARQVPGAVDEQEQPVFASRLSAVGGGSYVGKGKGLATHGSRLAARRVVRGQEAVGDGDWHDDPDSSSGRRQRRTARLIGEWLGAGGHAVFRGRPWMEEGREERHRPTTAQSFTSSQSQTREHELEGARTGSGPEHGLHAWRL